MVLMNMTFLNFFFYIRYSHFFKSNVGFLFGFHYFCKQLSNGHYREDPMMATKFLSDNNEYL